MFSNADEYFKFVKDEGVEYLDVRFTDLPGIQQQVTLPAAAFDADMAQNGVAFDGSSIRGFQSIDQSDMTLLPDFGTAYVDPFKARKTIAMDFFVHDPITGEAYSRDPRNIARKAEAYLATTGIGDTAYFAPEAEFYIFDRVNYGTSANKSFYEITSLESAWSTGHDITDNRGYKVRYKGGYFPVAPTDQLADLRNGGAGHQPCCDKDDPAKSHDVSPAGHGRPSFYACWCRASVITHPTPQGGTALRHGRRIFTITQTLVARP